MSSIVTHHGHPALSEKDLQLHGKSLDLSSLNTMPYSHTSVQLKRNNELLLRHAVILENSYWRSKET
jgi:hypothetical protein